MYFYRKLVQHGGGQSLIPGICLKLYPKHGAGEMVLQLRALVLAEIQAQFPAPNMVANDDL